MSFLIMVAFQALGKGVQGIIIAISRQGLLYIPLVTILPRFFGFNGVLAAQPIADLLSLILVACMFPQPQTAYPSARGRKTPRRIATRNREINIPRPRMDSGAFPICLDRSKPYQGPLRLCYSFRILKIQENKSAGGCFTASRAFKVNSDTQFLQLNQLILPGADAQSRRSLHCEDAVSRLMRSIRSALPGSSERYTRSRQA